MADNGGNGNVDRYARSTAWFIERIGFERSLILILVAGIGYLLIWQLPAREERFNDSIAAHDKLFTDALAQHDNRIIEAIPKLASQAATDTIQQFEQMRMWKESEKNSELEQKDEKIAELEYSNSQLKQNNKALRIARGLDHEDAKKQIKAVEKHVKPPTTVYVAVPVTSKAEAAHKHGGCLNDTFAGCENYPANVTSGGRPAPVQPSVGGVVTGVTGAIGAAVP